MPACVHLCACHLVCERTSRGSQFSPVTRLDRSYLYPLSHFAGPEIPVLKRLPYWINDLVTLDPPEKHTMGTKVEQL